MRNNRLCAQTQNFHRDPCRVSESKQGEGNPACLPFEGKEGNGLFCLEGSFVCVKQTSEVGSLLSRCPDPSGSPLGERGHTPSWGVGGGKWKLKVLLGTEVSRTQELTLQWRREVQALLSSLTSTL